MVVGALDKPKMWEKFISESSFLLAENFLLLSVLSNSRLAVTISPLPFHLDHSIGSSPTFFPGFQFTLLLFKLALFAFHYLKALLEDWPVLLVNQFMPSC